MPSTPSPGEGRIGPYIVLERLGTGGMGEVFLGEDTRLKRKVALKRLKKTHPDSDPLYARTLQEARAAARITHGNVAAIHDIIEHGSDAYIVMEFVEGESLATRLRRGPLPADEVLTIGRQLCAGLGAAHAQGVIHRDLKPANIQVSPTGSVKVLDFGVAQEIRLPGLSATDDTLSIKSEINPGGPRAGTPAYMAPEQLLDLPLDARTDLYSLGAVLYEMAIGKRPYEYVDPLELLRKPASLAQRADALNPDISKPLADVIDKALQCNAESRYQTARDMDEALANVQRLDTTRRWIRRSLWAAVAAGIAGLSIALLNLSETPPPASIRSIAVLPFVNLSGEPSQEYFVDGMTDGLINALGRVSALRVTARTSVMGFKGSKKPIADIARDLNVDAVLEGSALLVSPDLVRVTVNLIDPRTQTQLWSTQLERNVGDVVSAHGEIARTIAANVHVAVTSEEQGRLAGGPPVDPETFKLYLLGRHEWTGRTVPQLQRAVAYFRQAIERSPDYAPAHAGLADSIVLLTGDFAAMPRAAGAAEAIASASRALALDPTLAEAYTSLAFANFFLLWNWDSAEQQFKRALELNPSYATAHHWYGNYLSDIGREDEALVEIRRALELDPFSSIISRDVAWPLFYSRRYDEAIAHLDTTLKNFPGYQPAERLRARALAQRGNHAEAVVLFENQKQRADNPRSRCELAWAYALAGRLADAEKELQSALAEKSGVYQYDVALALTAMGRRDEALTALERAFAERDPTMVNLKHDPRFDPLRSDPRYGRLLAQMRFP